MIIKSSKRIDTNKRRIVAADDELVFDDDFANSESSASSEYDTDSMMSDESESSVNDQLDEISDKIDNMQDDLNDERQDNIQIDLDNNITGKYIAECEMCKGVFISAVQESSDKPESIQGICPLCNQQSAQYLKWIIHEA